MPFVTPLAAGTQYLVNIYVQHTQTASVSKGLKWPTDMGYYRVEANGDNDKVLGSLFFEVYGPAFNAATYLRGCIHIE